ncbi:hypothetical protein GZH53_11390 [Flavihumibacter sp. R14]|nr:hypothetical protein [Flavihumibacter soli]
MSLNDIIFSKRIPLSYARHIIFWVLWYIHPLFWDFLIFGFPHGDKIHIGLIHWLVDRLFDLGQNLVYCYFIVYYLIPKYVEKKKYLQFISAVLLLTVGTFLFNMYRLWYLQDIRTYFGPERDSQIVLFVWDSTRAFITQGSPVVCGFFITIKILKDYYGKLDEKSSLIRETSGAELQLLKAQVHPHFLFNTLNNIYSFTLNDPPKAADLVLQLSHTVQYMTTDCEEELVMLEKELKMIEDYIGLEKVRYGKRLDLRIDIKGDYQDKYIAPLLLIPFVENSFKHGSSKMLEHPWIRIDISAQDIVLHVKISNSKPADTAQINGASGIGLKNVRKRLELLYHDDYHLEIKNEVHSFHVELSVPLTVIKQPSESNAIPTLLNGTYATA